jgi:site-specific recombinase XerD
MSERTIGKIIEQCSRRAGINKRTYPHLLRHSLATHLIEDGVDIRYIQVLLGHTSILATSHYTHIAKMPNNIMECKINYLFEDSSN